MKDYVKQMIEWIAEDEQIALDNTGELVIDIDEAIRALKYQRDAIEFMAAHLQMKLHPEDFELPVTQLRPDQRSRIIKFRIQWLVDEGHTTITPQQVLERLEVDDLDLGVTHPTSVIATVLAKMVGFQRVRKGEFLYVGGGPLKKKES